MGDIIRRDPFLPDLEKLFRGFMVKPMFWERPFPWEGEGPGDIRLDITESDTQYAVRAEIPGAKKEDIKVEIDRNMISISAEVKKEKEEKAERAVRLERYFGAVSRSVALPVEVDPAGARAEYKDGVLQLTLPKKPGETARQISIS